MAAHHSDPVLHPEVQQASFTGYTVGFVMSLLLLLAALLLTEQHALPPLKLLGAISALAMVALFAQCFLFFGLNIALHNIWKSVSLVLTVPLFILTIGLTVWMFHQLDDLTMLPGTQVMPGMTMQPTLLQ
jgi:cytochrome o ubiquinol oxidase operon protein cyoD